MGKSVAKQLAAKGANIIIVSRNVDKLKEALEQIKVRAACVFHPTSMLTASHHAGRGSKPLSSTIPIHQCRPLRPGRCCARRRRSLGLEQWPRSGCRMVHRRRVIPPALPRDAESDHAAADGHQLLVVRGYGTSNLGLVARTGI